MRAAAGSHASMALGTLLRKNTKQKEILYVYR